MALAMAAGGALAPAHAQAGDDALYGIPGEGAPADTGAKPSESETPVPATPDTVAAADSIEAVSGDSAEASADTVRAPRQRITRETVINPLDTRRGAYRNPKKALFLSLMVPGLGQAYVGQSTFNYVRAAVYFSTEIGLGLLWYQYTVVKYDRQTKRYRRFADTAWSQGEYEDAVEQATFAVEQPVFDNANRYRTSYCDAVTGRGTVAQDSLYARCANPYGDNYASNFKPNYDDRTFSQDSTGAFRALFDDPVEFYALIGSYQEFIGGWNDAQGVIYADSISGSSANRDTYNAMRQKAQDYSRMQTWFIGGIVINHIASAVDAALTARHNNRVLYQGEARWHDRLHVDGGLAFDAGRPRTHMTARLSF